MRSEQAKGRMRRVVAPILEVHGEIRGSVREELLVGENRFYEHIEGENVNRAEQNVLYGGRMVRCRCAIKRRRSSRMRPSGH